MRKLILSLILLYCFASFAECVKDQKSARKFICDGLAFEVKCDNDDDECRFELEDKIRKTSLNIDRSGEIQKLLEFDRNTGKSMSCEAHPSLLVCSVSNNCQNDKIDLDNILQTGVPKTTSECNSSVKILNNSNLKTLRKAYCSKKLEELNLTEGSENFFRLCKIDTNRSSDDFDCELVGLINSLDKKTKYQNETRSVFLNACIKNKNIPSEFDNNLKNNLILFFKNLKQMGCENQYIEAVNLEKIVCIKVQELLLDAPVVCKSNGSIYSAKSIKSSELTQKYNIQSDTEVKDQPIAEYKRELPTEAPKINHQETLSKIDKLIADNGGNVTPEVAQKAGEIFNAGIYQPTKNFLKTVEQAIGSASSSTSGSSSSSSKYRSSKSKTYEIGSKGARNNRVIANVDTAEATAASTTAMNTKISTSTGNVVPSLEKNSAEGASDNMGKENKQASPGFVSNNSSGPSSMGGQVGGSAVGALANNGPARNAELQELPALSSSDKTQISLVVKALKEAESPEDIKSIVTVEENYSQVKRMIQELEQKKRQPASQQNSTEIKEFEKTLNKFGIKVYGESGPGKAVYTPTMVNHVIVLKDNSIRFLNTIRSKR